LTTYVFAAYFAAILALLSEAQLAQWSSGTKTLAVMRRENVDSLKIRHPLAAGNYYLCFVGADPDGQVKIWLRLRCSEYLLFAFR
jgi:hypothetical protein